LAGFVWGYALLWFLLNDRVKLLAYRIFDPVKKFATNPKSKLHLKPDAKGDAKVMLKLRPNPRRNLTPAG